MFAAPLLLVLTMAAGCASSEDELSRALQEIDSREYAAAVERLEALARNDPSIRSSDVFVDRLSSAYLGLAGVDLIETLGQWATTYEGFESLGEASEDAANLEGAGNPAQPSIAEYGEAVDRLLPNSLKVPRNAAILEKALQLCSSRVAATERQGRPSNRILLKTIFVNLWASLRESHVRLLPAAELLANRPSSADLCAAARQLRESAARVAGFSLSIRSAFSMLRGKADTRVRKAAKLGDLTASLDWSSELGCEGARDEAIDGI